MWILALETATPTASVALINDGQVVVEHNERSRRRHAESLVPTIESLLKEQGLTPQDLGAVACGRGPGSFTGLRIGLSTAKGLAQALGLPLITVSTLDILAAAAFFPGGLLAPLLDAKQGHIYVAFYEKTWPFPQPLTGYLALRPPELAAEALRLAAGREVAVCGDGIALAREALEAAGVTVRELPTPFSYPRAGVLGMLAFAELAKGAVGDAAAAEPLYVRRAAAELAREAKHGSRS